MYLNTQHSKCIVLQYNFQQYTFILLQYNSLAYLQASLQYNSLYCNTIFQPLSPPIAIYFLSQKDYIAIQSVNHQAPLLQYNSHPTSLLLQYKTKPTTLQRLQIQFSYCNTIPTQLHPSLAIQLQYNSYFLVLPLAIQLQGCNTKQKKFTRQLGSSPKTVFAHFFFFSLPAISSSWKNHPNIFFFLFLQHSNKFIKICFTPFSSILQLVKL